ncbi:hypothetical protein EMQ25_06020 [Arsenicitalea aurantiaca]|uniref:Outer membrane protein beta-barrel domain-containing protein n=1 Tax=Arsenicitalea aurantiaca TaxID=1783274 RepID=A0A433XF16_9HYPH|nr:hypothetical protein [Arsenicitalea aurantiaca]RUT32699.1 hypothetical protein EMQ25_06020 [Arsenicitalea aurantiaca]
MITSRALLIALAGAALSVQGAVAADYSWGGGPVDQIYSSPMFNFEGFYVGGTVSAVGLDDGGAFGLGVVTGNNFMLTDSIVAGIEFQGDLYFNEEGITAYDALGLGRIGGFLTTNTMIYGALGAGVFDDNLNYAFGAGVEQGLGGPISVRGEILGLGDWGQTPDHAKGTLGLIWHMN